MKDKRKFLLFKKEVTEGVDPSPGASDAIRTMGVTPQIYQGDKVPIVYDKGDFGSSKTINVAPQNGLTFRVPIASSGTAGTAPQWNELLLCCGFEETLNSTPDNAEYTHISANIDSGTAYFLLPQDAGVSDEVHESNGMRGNMSFTMTGGQIPVFDFNFIGSYVTPVESAAVTGTYTGWVDPIPLTYTNTATVTVDGTAACLQSLTHNCNNVVTYQNLPGCQGTIISDANYSGSVHIRAPDLSTKNYFTKLESHSTISTVAIQVVHGTTAGYIIQIDYTTAQLQNVTYEPINGAAAWRIDFLDIDNSLKITSK